MKIGKDVIALSSILVIAIGIFYVLTVYGQQGPVRMPGVTTTTLQGVTTTTTEISTTSTSTTLFQNQFIEDIVPDCSESGCPTGYTCTPTMCATAECVAAGNCNCASLCRFSLIDDILGTTTTTLPECTISGCPKGYTCKQIQCIKAPCPSQCMMVVSIMPISPITLPGEQPTVIGMANPASVNCGTLGGILQIVDTPAGQTGMCTLPNGHVCEEWALFNGQCS